MASVTFTKFNTVGLYLGQAAFNFPSDTLKVMLTNVQPLATNALKADITEIAAGNGYVAGGNVASLVSWSQSGGVAKLVLNSPSIWTASGGTIASHRWAVLYDDTPTSPLKPLLGYMDYTISSSEGIGETFEVDFDPTGGVFAIA